MSSLKIAIFCPNTTFQSHKRAIASLTDNEDLPTFITHKNIYISRYGGESVEFLWHLIEMNRAFIAGVGVGVIANAVYDIVKNIFARHPEARVEIEHFIKIDSVTVTQLSPDIIARFLSNNDDERPQDHNR